MWKPSQHLMETIRHYASFPATGVSLRQMVQFGDRPSTGTLFRASQFLSEELPIRLAHRVQDLGELPDGLSEMPSIKKVQDWYAQSFEVCYATSFSPGFWVSLRRLDLDMLHDSLGMISPGNHQFASALPDARSQDPPVATGPDERQCLQNTLRGDSEPQRARGPIPLLPNLDQRQRERKIRRGRGAPTLQQIKRRHDSVVTTVAQGILEWKRVRQRMQIDPGIQSFLDRFYMSRIGIRMLIGQHIALTEQTHVKHPNYVGIICTKTNVRDIALEAIENARFVCEDYYGLFEAPKVQLVCKDNLNFMYVPGHLSHMLFETLKNSLRAVVEQHGADRDSFPVTKVIVAEGKEDITIKVSDEGGGIARSAIPLVWTYMYTTVEQTPNLDPDFDKSDFKAPMAGFGYGLPISRLYARYFGGDLKLISMEGYGTDVYLHLNRLSSSSEPLQ
ncbi:kinase [Penicillium capsulatum]|uniref:Protein-serine/threonine kinase n=1 Tax=Penicillium capsulatum TaxID=69766 RepID=A0A9W9I973_9EURO|nr:kinase [Penicillium capsulatum]